MRFFTVCLIVKDWSSQVFCNRDAVCPFLPQLHSNFDKTEPLWRHSKCPSMPVSTGSVRSCDVWPAMALLMIQVKAARHHDLGRPKYLMCTLQRSIVA
jgi:hypothetical protein